MRRLLINVCALVMILIQPFSGWSYDGAALSQDCMQAVKQYDAGVKKVEPSEESLAAERCKSYTFGAFSVLRSLRVNKQSLLLCAPATVQQEQVVRIVAKWLKDNPSKLHLSAEYAASVSLRDAFPCPKKAKTPTKRGSGKDI